jgi:hypothetical protein
MPLTLQPFDDSPLCFGHTWTITDEEALALTVAWLVVGEYLHARDVLRALDSDLPKVRRGFLDKQIASFSTRPDTDAARWHRDGWVFQMVSWIAIRLAGPQSLLVRAPQPRKSDKGLDGLIVSLPSSSEPGYLILCEDKATDDARTMVRSKVWPEFAAFENAERDNEVVTEVSALLESLPAAVDRRQVIQDVMWREKWRYRVAVTIKDDHDSKSGRAALFADYDTCVPGNSAERRRAETVCSPELRTWMDHFCTRIAHHLATALCRSR